MRQLTSPQLLALLREIAEQDEGLAIYDQEGHWKGVILTAEAYQLLKGIADLAADPEQYLAAHEANLKYQRGENTHETMSLAEVFSKKKPLSM